MSDMRFELIIDISFLPGVQERLQKIVAEGGTVFLQKALDSYAEEFADSLIPGIDRDRVSCAFYPCTEAEGYCSVALTEEQRAEEMIEDSARSGETEHENYCTLLHAALDHRCLDYDEITYSDGDHVCRFRGRAGGREWSVHLHS